MSKFVLSSEKKAKTFTNLDKKDRQSLWNFLGDDKDKLNMIGMVDTKSGDLNIPIQCQFILTLMILRRGYDFIECAYFFRIPRGKVSNIFSTWLQFMYFKFNDKEFTDRMCVRRQDMPSPLPLQFQTKPLLRNIRFVGDCTSISIMKPGNYALQSITWEQYKHENTVKFVRFDDPFGGVSFISQAYGGSISDNQMFKDCGVLEKTEKGDGYLLDRYLILAKHTVLYKFLVFCIVCSHY